MAGRQADASCDSDVRLSLDGGNVRYSLNPMRSAGPSALSANDAHRHFDAHEQSDDSGVGHWAMRGLMQLLPRTYFREPIESKAPIAPPRLALASFAFELIAAAIAFSAMCWYFRSIPTQQTTITLALLPGQTCSVLNPMKDTTFYSAEHSENAQFASPYMTSTECVSLLTRLDVCGDGRRLDHVTLWGVSHPNTTHYYPGGQGYLSFTPTQTPGLATQLVPFFQPSVSFPKPDISRPAFLGSDSNWYLYNFANNTAADAFMSVPGVPASTFLYDASTNIVYDPVPVYNEDSESQQRDYDLSSSIPNADRFDVIGTMGKVTGVFDVGNIGVNAGVYYGLRGAAVFYGPHSVAVDATGNLFVADEYNDLVRRIDATKQAVTNLGTSASPAFKQPAGVAVDALGNVFVADRDNNLVRRIDAKTQAVTSLGTSASPAFDWPRGVAVDAAGNVYVADLGNNLVRRIDTKTQAVTSLGTSASPAFNRPSGVAVDAAGNVYVADLGNNLVRRIDTKTQAVTSLGTSASPAFNRPSGMVVDAAGNVYVADKGNNLVRRIDAKTQVVTSLGTSASPAFNNPYGVAVDAAGNVYVAEGYPNNLVRRIDAKTEAVTRYVGSARVLSWDMRINPNPSSFTLWPDTALNDHYSSSISVVDSAAGGCQNVLSGGNGMCYLLVQAEVSPTDGRLYVELQQFSENKYSGSTNVYILDPSRLSQVATEIRINAGDVPSRQLWGVFHTPNSGTILLTSLGAANDKPKISFTGTVIDILDDFAFTKLVTAAGTSIVDASAIPSETPGEPARFLLLTLREKGLNKMYTYDAFTDTIASSNAAAAATTHAMLAFTWGVCDGSVTRSLVELSFSNAYSNECPLPKTGLYYQSPNVYYAIPYACLAIPYDKLLTDCAEIRANLKALVDASCPASVAKVCRQQYDLNPPFSCVTDVYPSVLTVISLSSANTTTIASFLALVVAALLARAHRHYRPSEQDIALANARPLDHTDANSDDVNIKSRKHSVSGQGPGIEMLSPYAHAQTQPSADGAVLAAMRAMQDEHRRLERRMEAEMAQLRALVVGAGPVNSQPSLLYPPASPATRLSLSALPSFPQALPPVSTFNMPPPIPPQRRPSQQQRPSWSAETLSYDEGQGIGGRL